MNEQMHKSIISLLLDLLYSAQFLFSESVSSYLRRKAYLLVMSLPNSEAMIYQEVRCFGCAMEAFRQEQEVIIDSGVRGKLRRGGVWEHLLQEQSSPTPP